jgi:hypothetical protein
MVRFLRRDAAPAPQHPIDEVLEAERVAAAAIAAGRLEANQWLAGERAAIASAMDAALAALAARVAVDEEAARDAAVAAAAEEIAAADAFSRALGALTDRDLLPIVARRVASIIPGPEP